MYLASHQGKPCTYCKQPMNMHDPDLSPTRDHHPVPKSRGGQRTIVCCYKCNNIKGDMTAAEWEVYMVDNPGWWKVTTLDRRQKRAAKREAARTEKWGPRGSRVIRQAEKPSTPMADALAGLAQKLENDGDLYRGRPSRRSSSEEA